ncbi:MAG: hypothetical protein WCD18_25695, partial [Thermosynechococcaceae cyanobacterium]
QQQPTHRQATAREKSVPIGHRRSAQGAKALGSVEIGLKSVVASTQPRSTQIKVISGLSAEPYIRLEPSADRVWETVPQTDAGLQLRIGGYL